MAGNGHKRYQRVPVPTGTKRSRTTDVLVATVWEDPYAEDQLPLQNAANEAGVSWTHTVFNKP